MTAAFLFAFALCGAASAVMDALSDYRNDTIFAAWDSWVGHYMVRGPSESRKWIPAWLPGPAKSFLRLWADGWHLAKAVMLGTPLAFGAWLVSWGWGSFAVLLAGGYVALASTFFLLYHRYLHQKDGWHGL